jgi:hypothetical protein
MNFSKSRTSAMVEKKYGVYDDANGAIRVRVEYY